MMTKFVYFFPIILMSALFLTCAGSITPGANLIEYTANVGTGSAYDVKDKVQRLLIRYQYEVVRTEQTVDQIYFETEWKNRTPFDDEGELDMVEGRTRFIINATHRVRSSTAGADRYVVHVKGENMVRYSYSQEWARVPMTKMLRAYFVKFAEDLRLELRTGIRVF